jgi:hypothetical protein
VSRPATSGRLIAAVAVALAAAVPAVAAAAGSPAQVAVFAAKQSFKGAHAAQWQLLHPKYKQVVTKSRFVSCERKLAGSVGRIVVKNVQAEGTRVIPATVPLLGKVQVNGVTMAITYTRPGVKGSNVAEVESYWVAYKGKYVRVLLPAEYGAYKAGRCP